jgi:hypothetical protein
VRHNYEFGECWSTKDGVVGAVEVCDHEVNVVGVEVLCSHKLNRERDLSERYRALSREDALELCLVGFKIGLAQF